MRSLDNGALGLSICKASSGAPLAIRSEFSLCPATWFRYYATCRKGGTAHSQHMSKRMMKKRGKKAGLPPGSLVYVGEHRPSHPRMTVFDYDEGRCLEKTLTQVEECLEYRDTASPTWINIDHIQQIDMLEKLGKHFGLHPLVLEDILNTDQRPKLEDHGHYLYTVVKMLDYEKDKGELAIEQLSLVLGRNFVISFQDQPGDVLDPLRERIRNGRGRIRKMGADYLFYALLDTVVDQYFVVLEKLGDRVELIEEIVATNPRPPTLPEIHKLKREIILLRKAVWPLREMIVSLQHDESGLLHESTSVYLRDLLDHVMQIGDGIDAYRDMLASSLEVYLSTISNRTNGVMKVLALFSAIFMPLTFITGIFGMNFKNFPELDWKYGFQGTVVIMVVLGAGMLWFFKRRKWL
jgi:magnesium transporter